MRTLSGLGAALLLGALGLAAAAPCAAAGGLSLEQALGYRFVSDLTAADHADRIAWVEDVRGVRNVFLAEGPAFAPRQLTRYTDDDGQEITGLAFSPDGSRLVFVRGGDHDANWPAEGKLAPDPAADPQEPKVAIWSEPIGGGAPVKLAEGDSSPAISARGRASPT